VVPQYFDESPHVESDVRNIDVALAGLAFTMQTDRGVFSHGHVDTGTALLLHEAPPPSPRGDLLDLGCGSGAIALTLALRSPEATVWAIDTNERARHLTERNAERNGLENIRVCAPSSVPLEIEFDTIWSNPPIRIGKAALHELLEGWLARLTLDGAAIMVVQKHLGADSLQRWLIRTGYPTERIAGRAGFRLFETRRESGQPTVAP
jgi:16S rRNA (guanine1207-N2)-methyltransferase